MNKQTMHAIRKQGQAGFTLIELIVVIVILGILAATALPKFSNLGGDARLASLNAARGALAGTSATAHGQWLVNPALPSVSNEGQAITFSTYTNAGATVSTGYPTANTSFAIAAGLNATDYIVTASAAGAAATATLPAIPAKGFVVVPKSVSGTASGATCFISYTEANGVGTSITPPVISAVPTSNVACQ